MPETPVGNYNQSSLQAFFFFYPVQGIEAGDWILAYTMDGLLCGGREIPNSQAVVDVPVMGDEGEDYTEGYPHVGDPVQFKIYKQATGDTLDCEVVEGMQTWSNNYISPVLNLQVVSDPVEPPDDDFVEAMTVEDGKMKVFKVLRENMITF